jgi:hypothetical protein
MATIRIYLGSGKSLVGFLGSSLLLLLLLATLPPLAKLINVPTRELRERRNRSTSLSITVSIIVSSMIAVVIGNAKVAQLESRTRNTVLDFHHVLVLVGVLIGCNAP